MKNFKCNTNNLLLPLKNDEFDVYRKEYNNLIKKKTKELKKSAEKQKTEIYK